ncbi:complex I NDUFA9 subunit family protein [Pararhizobium haloflavum]|uniref:complex I NDUFA9 subunit family protein n=1 Tax=Pararhizobium haloflavum TaxID=2037914 RepID=UPI000C18C73D|nr:complex I NDUFA9 subunit family protein [Pararhizobium haloflavum]
MTTPPHPKLITVFGGAGFVGRHVIRALAQRGYRVRVACRKPHLASFLQPLGAVGQIMAVQANLRYRESVDRAVKGSDHVINLVGILYETGRNGFDSVQDFGARAVAEAARAEGVPLTHMSAIGADPHADSDYARTKGLAEASVREIVPDALIIRPSIIFGPEDGFFNKFAEMSRIAPALPLIGGGKTRLQPVYVGDVAEVFARHVDGAIKGGQVLELGGPQVLTFRECMEEMLKVIQRKRAFVSIPWSIASLMGRTFAHVPLIAPPITGDQVKQLRRDNVVSKDAIQDGRTLEGLGIQPTLLDAILPSYLMRFRVQGQFTKPDAVADRGEH